MRVQLQATLKRACELLGEDDCPAGIAADDTAWAICEKKENAGECGDYVACWTEYFLALEGGVK
jgi:hypothetical protein